ncbi:hypothetical protein Ahy_A02g008996 [Arachis hypogaea]|uniref:Pentatricopeptide repeat-containing protein n=1 Tax=Arachis hypogaea TaxID=3818 RepID=A0A445EFN1_ARAHY|nr:hypothetical protein Ahy_A02g008996 [Arachis hypogaea]
MGKTRATMELLQKLESYTVKPNIVMYRTLIDGLRKDGSVNEAQNLFSEMISRGIYPDIVSFNSLMHGLCCTDRLKEATQLLNDMVVKDINPDVCTYNILLDALWRIPDVQNFLEDMYARGQLPNIITYNILLDNLCKGSHLDVAIELFPKIFGKGGLVLMPYTILIDGFYNHGRHKTAEEVFNLLHNKGWRDVKAIDAMTNGLCRIWKSSKYVFLCFEVYESPLITTVSNALHSSNIMPRNAKSWLIEFDNGNPFQNSSTILFL